MIDYFVPGDVIGYFAQRPFYLCLSSSGTLTSRPNKTLPARTEAYDSTTLQLYQNTILR